MKIRGLVNVTLPNNLTALANSTFRYCYSLQKIIIPKSVLSIGSTVFNSCSALEYIDFSEHEEVPTLDNNNSFTSIYINCKIIVPDNLYEDWITASVWSNVSRYIVKASEANIS